MKQLNEAIKISNKMKQFNEVIK